MNPLVTLAVLVPVSLVLLLIASYTQVETGSIKATFLLGRFWRVLRPGPHLVIPLIERTEFHSTQAHQHELPDEPENIDRISEVAPPGKKLPFRVPHKGMEEAIFYVKKEYDAEKREGDPFDNTRELEDSVTVPGLKTVRFSELPETVQEAMKADSLNAPLTSEVAAIVEWQLEGKDPVSIENFIQNVSPEAGRNREEEIRKRAEDMVSRVLQEYLAPTTLGHAIYMAPLFSRLIRKRMEVFVGEEADPKTGEKADKPLGIHIREAFLKPFYAGKTVNTARSEAGASVSLKFKTIRDSEAQAQATINKALADKAAEIAKGEGEAGRIAAMAKVMKEPEAKFIAELDVKERFAEAYENNNTVVTYAPGANNTMLPLDTSGKK